MRRFRDCVTLTVLCLTYAFGSHALPGNPLEGLARLKPGETQRASSSDPNWHNGNGDARGIPPGETLVIAELAGPGVITHIWNTIAAQERGYSRLLVVRMYWDGEEHPSVEAPIGDFFGIGHGLDHPFSSLPVTVTSQGRARNCYWPMPFRKSARITVENQGRKRINAFYYYVDWQQLTELPEDTACFHAMYRQEHPAVMGRNYLIAEIEGRGHYVGTVQSVRQRTPSWWGEGDDFFFIDGEEEPRLRGTGSEDYYCDAWGLREMATPFYGAPLMQGYDAYSMTTCYRWHITDPVCFNTSLRVEIEHKGVAFNEDGTVRSGFEERADDFSSVAFWYQLEPHKPWPRLPAAYDRLYVDYSKTIEAEGLLPNVTSTSVAASAQEGGWSGGAQLFWTEPQAEQTLTIPFEVSEGGEHSVLLMLTHSWDYGIFEFAIDGVPIGKAVDLYNKTVVTKDKIFGPMTLEAGERTLTVRNVGKNAESEGYFFGLDGILVGK